MGPFRLRLAVGAAVFCGGLMTPGCGSGVDDSDIGATAGPPPADAPKTPAEYDAKYPLPNAGDRAKSKTRGPTVTEP